MCRVNIASYSLIMDGSEKVKQNGVTPLQHLCLISIVNRLEQYSDEYLSLLPNKVRLELLRRLPVVDVCRLESSEFVGLDTTDVWKALYKRHYSQYINPGGSDRRASYHDSLDTNNFLVKLKSKSKDIKDCYLNMIWNIILNDARPSGYWEVWEEEESDEEEPSEPAVPCTDKINVSNPIEYVPNDIVNYLVAVERTVLFSESSIVDEADSRSPSQAGSQLSITVDGGDSDPDTSDESWFSYNPLTWGNTVETDKPSSRYIEACRLRQYIPHRYSSMLDQTQCRIKDGDALSLLMTRCNYQPTHVILNKVWVGQCGHRRIERKNIPEKLLTDGLCEVSSLDVQYSCISSHIDPLRMIVGCEQPHLSSLSLSASTKIIEAIKYLHGLVTSRTSNCQGVQCLLTNLKELGISGYVYHSLKHSGARRLLATIVEKLVGLESLRIECGESDSVNCSRLNGSDHELCLQLRAFLNRPTFRLLTLRSLRLSQIECQELILDFLARPCSVEQTLHLAPVITDANMKKNSRKSIVLAEKSYDFKSLHLDTPDAPFVLIPLLKQQPSIHLKHLEVSCVGYHPSGTLLGVPKLYVELSMHSDLRTQTLVVKECPRNETLSQQQALVVERLFFSRYLHHLTISDNELPSYLEGLTRGLLQQAYVNTLRELNLISSQYVFLDNYRSWLDKFSSTQGRAFFNALFQLPQLEELSFSLHIGFRWDEDSNQDLRTMYSSWKECSQGKHLKDLKLGCIYRLPKELATQLKEMGAKFTVLEES